MAVEVKTTFPTITEVRELRPGFLPYIVAKEALVDDVLADYVRSRYEVPRVQKSESKERDITAAIKGLYAAQCAGELQPPLPSDITGVLGDMVTVFSRPLMPEYRNPAEHTALSEGNNLEAARLVLELSVAHGYSNLSAQGSEV